MKYIIEQFLTIKFTLLFSAVVCISMFGYMYLLFSNISNESDINGYQHFMIHTHIDTYQKNTEELLDDMKESKIAYIVVNKDIQTVFNE